MNVNVASACEAIAAARPDLVALVHGSSTTSWGELDRRATLLAGALAARGIGPGDKVAFFLHNCSEYLEGLVAVFKLRAVPVNVNYRYREHELAYLLDNADAVAVLYGSALAGPLGVVCEQHPRQRALVEVGGVGTPRVADAEHYEDLVSDGPPAPRIERSGDDILLLYTGGTTGMPKGVMWPVATFLGGGIDATYAAAAVPAPATLGQVGAATGALADAGGRPVLLVASPLMHGVGLSTSLGVLCLGGSVVTLTSPKFDPDELWTTVERQQVTHVSIVGDPFARPMLQTLERQRSSGSKYDLSSLRRIVSAGAMWSSENKQRLLEWGPFELIDTLASTEAAGLGQAVTSRDVASATAAFSVGPNAIVLRDDGSPVEPGSADAGMLAVSNPIPLGYYKDDQKTAETFRTVNGTRYAFSGDHARVDADGTILLLGRGSTCINTGGEKVFPEEVEEVVKTHPGVVDCLVIGVADDRWGEVVAAAVSTDGTVAEDDVRDLVRSKLASFKVPKVVVLVERVPRGPNGKADYDAAREAVAHASSRG